jgi:aminoglycoside phosphotransferase (APT) family kinase protein
LAGAGLSNLARPGSLLERQTERWAREWGTDRAEDVGHIRSWLHAHRPSTEPRVIVHGDFKLTNLRFDFIRADVVGVLDWELAAIGDPMLDLGHIWSAVWATTPDEYGGVLGVDLDAACLPTADEFLAEYFAAAGIGTELDPFYRVLALFRNSGIFHGIGRRAEAGTATAANASQQGATAHAYLQRALDITRS